MQALELSLKSDCDVVAAWKASLALGRSLGLPTFQQACLSAAMLELGRRLAATGQGRCRLADASDEQTVRACVVFDADCNAGDLAAKLDTEVRIGPSLPAVRLRSALETCRFETIEGRMRATVTVGIARSMVKQSRASAASAARRR